MGLLELIALIVIGYIAYMILKSFRSMERQLQELKQVCGVQQQGASPPPPESTFSDVSKSMIKGLEKLLLATQP